jgi:hypothetical protein
MQLLCRYTADPVVWVNELPLRDFTEGFGSHTPVTVGQSRVARYGGAVHVASS